MNAYSSKRIDRKGAQAPDSILGERVTVPRLHLCLDGTGLPQVSGGTGQYKSLATACKSDLYALWLLS